MHTLFVRTWLVAATFLFISLEAHASSILFTGSQGTLSASALFKVSPGSGDTGRIEVTLTNTADSWSGKHLVPSDGLTAIFFNLTGGDVVLTPLSALVPLGSSVLPTTKQPYDGNDVGAFWQYADNANHPVRNKAPFAITSTGLDDVFGHANFGCTACNPVNGLNYGIVPASYERGDGNGGVEKDPLIRNSVVFTLKGDVPEGVKVENVWFQYGTSKSQPRFQGFPEPGGAVPEPGTTLLIGCGLLAVGAVLRKRHGRSA